MRKLSSRKYGFRYAVATLVTLGTISFAAPQSAQAAIGFRNASSNNNAGGTTSLSIAMPTGTTQGDVMVAVISVRGGTGTSVSVVPTGWVQINANNSTTDIKSVTYYKVAGVGEAGPYVWGWATALKASGVISGYTGVDNQAPVMAHGSQVNASSTTMTAPSVTTLTDNAWLVAAYSTATGTTVTAGSSMTLRGQSASTSNSAGSRTTSGLQDVVQATAGASGAKTMTAGAAAVNIGHTIALNPAAVLEQSAYRWFSNTDSAVLPSGASFARTWGGDGTDTTRTVALDASGNIYVAGGTNSTGLNTGSYDITLVKYNSSGIEQWSKTLGDSATSESMDAMVLDSSGNIYVAGVVSTSGISDHLLVKYNSSGIEQWSKTWGGDSFDTAYSLVLDSSGNIYVAGSTISTGLTAGGYDQTLVKYNSSGIEQWSKTWGGDSYDYGYDLVLDASGNIYVCGYVNSTGLTSGLPDQTLVKYNSSGIEQWSKTWGSDGAEYAQSLALDTSGNIYVAGYTDSTSLSSGGIDQTLVKYNSSGNEQWSKTWGGDGDDSVYALVMDGSDNVYVAGNTNSTSLSNGGVDQTLVKYNSSGIEQWSTTWGGDGNDYIYSLALDSSGNIYATGSTTTTGLATGGPDQVLLRFDGSGDIAGCDYCVDRTMTEVDRTMTEVDRTMTEVDRTMTEVDRTMTEVDRTGLANVVIACTLRIDVGASIGGVAQNTAATAPAQQQIFRLRVLLHVGSGGGVILRPALFGLQYATKSGVCDTGFAGEVYADVTTSSLIAYADNTNATDGTWLTANVGDPTHNSDVKVYQDYNEVNYAPVLNTVALGQDGLWDFALKDNGAPASTSYCFRLVKSDGGTLSTYSFVPEITTQAVVSGPTLDQQMRGGGSVVSGTKGSLTW